MAGGLVPYVAAEAAGGPWLALPMLFGEGYQRHVDDAATAAAARGEEQPDVTKQALAGGALNLALGLPIFKAVKGGVKAIVPGAARAVQETVENVFRTSGMQGVERLMNTLDAVGRGRTANKEAMAALGQALEAIDKEVKAPLTAAFRRVLRHTAAGAGTFAGVTTGHNLIAQSYDPDRPTLQGVPEALVTGGFLSAIGAAAGEHGNVRNAREAQEWLRQKYQEKPIESAPPALPGPAGEATAPATEPAVPPAPMSAGSELKSFSQLPAPATAEPTSAAAMMLQRMAAAQPPAPAPVEPDPAPLSPSEPVAAPTAVEGETLPAGPGIVSNVPMSAVAVRADLMQFKRSDDTGAGTNAQDRIQSAYDPLKAGVTLLWEPSDAAAHDLDGGQRFIVVNGHHRHNLRERKSVADFPAQILRETDGVSAVDARRIGAEINIADGKGSIYDHANFFRDTAAVAGADVALERARALGVRSRKGANIGLTAAPDLYAAFINERVSPDHAEAIALAAPLEPGLQRVGLAEALQGASPQEAGNVIEAVKASLGAEPSPEQVDMFGNDDAALNASRAIARRAGAVQREIAEQISSVQGASRRPEKARALGVNVADPAAVQAKLAALQQAREQWRHWGRQPELLNLLRDGHSPADILGSGLADGRATPAPQLRIGERQGELLQGTDQPFNLAGETGVDYTAQAQQAAAEAQATAEAQRAQDAAQGDMFGRAGIDGSEGGYISGDGYAALVDAGRNFYRKGMDFATWAARMIRRFSERVIEFLHHVWRSLTGQNLLPHAQERGTVDFSRPDIRAGNKKDGYRPVALRQLDKIPIADLPALVNLTRELLGDVPQLKRLAKARGYFKHGTGSGAHIVLDPRLFSDPTVAAKVLAHEIGHAGDFLPEGTLKRGNLLGRLATLQSISRLRSRSTRPAARPRSRSRTAAVSGAQRRKRAEPNRPRPRLNRNRRHGPTPSPIDTVSC